MTPQESGCTKKLKWNLLITCVNFSYHFLYFVSLRFQRTWTEFELKILNFIFRFYCLGYYKLFWLNLLELLPLLISVLSATNLVNVLIDKHLHHYFLSECIYNSKFNANSFSSLTPKKRSHFTTVLS